MRKVDIGYMFVLSALVHRSLLNTIRNPMLLKSKFFQSIFTALFIGGLFFGIGTNDYTNKQYWSSITGFLFFSTINSLIMTLSPIILTFPLEREVFFKEQDSKMYNLRQYFLARNLVELP